VRTPPATILLDEGITAADRLEFVERLRSIVITATVPVVVLTSQALESASLDLSLADLGAAEHRHPSRAANPRVHRTTDTPASADEDVVQRALAVLAAAAATIKAEESDTGTEAAETAPAADAEAAPVGRSLRLHVDECLDRWRMPAGMVEVKGSLAGVTDETADLAMMVVRESIANAVKHAQAAHIEVEAIKVGTRLMVRVADDGTSMVPADDRSGSVGRQYRVALIERRVIGAGGRMSVDSRPGKGTAIIAFLRLTAATVETRPVAEVLPEPVPAEPVQQAVAAPAAQADSDTAGNVGSVCAAARRTVAYGASAHAGRGHRRGQRRAHHGNHTDGRQTF
jgi:CheY-like chemotaxis protein